MAVLVAGNVHVNSPATAPLQREKRAQKAAETRSGSKTAGRNCERLLRLPRDNSISVSACAPSLPVERERAPNLFLFSEKGQYAPLAALCLRPRVAARESSRPT